MSIEAQQKAAENFQWLGQNDYPGRGVVLGQLDPEHWGGIYWIMGRSANSRNRRFVYEDQILRTEPADPSLVEDPSLILYNALRRWERCWVLTNGSQTDVILSALQQGKPFAESLEGQHHEPDAPNFTPRISGLLDFRGTEPQIWLSSLRRSLFTTSESDHRIYHFRQLAPGYGVALTTYEQDGNPLPTFDRPPMLLPLQGDLSEIAGRYWEQLQKDHRISLAVFRIHARSLEQEMHVHNRYQPQPA